MNRQQDYLSDGTHRTSRFEIMSICKYLTSCQVFLKRYNPGLQRLSFNLQEIPRRQWSLASTHLISDLARFLPICPSMGRMNTSADALIEILDLCEQTLTAVCQRDEASAQLWPSDKSSQSRQQMCGNVTRRLVLIQGGLPGNVQHPTPVEQSNCAYK